MFVIEKFKKTLKKNIIFLYISNRKKKMEKDIKSQTEALNLIRTQLEVERDTTKINLIIKNLIKTSYPRELLAKSRIIQTIKI